MTDPQSRKRSYTSVFGGLPYARWKWGEDPTTIPYGYLPPKAFHQRIDRLLQLGGCTQENHDRWVQMYKDKRKDKGEQHSRRARVSELWEPILAEFDRHINIQYSSCKYFTFKVEAMKLEEYRPHLEANIYYLKVLQKTRSGLYKVCVRNNITPKEMLERLCEENPARRQGAYPDRWKDWQEFVPLSKQKIIREAFAALPRNYRGKRKLPFALNYKGENSRATEAAQRAEQQERKEKETQYAIDNWDTGKKLHARSHNDFWCTEDELKEMGEIPKEK